MPSKRDIRNAESKAAKAAGKAEQVAAATGTPIDWSKAEKASADLANTAQSALDKKTTKPANAGEPGVAEIVARARQHRLFESDR